MGGTPPVYDPLAQVGREGVGAPVYAPLAPVGREPSSDRDLLVDPRTSAGVGAPVTEFAPPAFGPALDQTDIYDTGSTWDTTPVSDVTLGNVAFDVPGGADRWDTGGEVLEGVEPTLPDLEDRCSELYDEINRLSDEGGMMPPPDLVREFRDVHARIQDMKPPR